MVCPVRIDHAFIIFLQQINREQGVSPLQASLLFPLQKGKWVFLKLNCFGEAPVAVEGNCESLQWSFKVCSIGTMQLDLFISCICLLPVFYAPWVFLPSSCISQSDICSISNWKKLFNIFTYTANAAVEMKVLRVLDRLLFWELDIIDQDI